MLFCHGVELVKWVVWILFYLVVVFVCLVIYFHKTFKFVLVLLVFRLGWLRKLLILLLWFKLAAFCLDLICILRTTFLTSVMTACRSLFLLLNFSLSNRCILIIYLTSKLFFLCILQTIVVTIIISSSTSLWQTKRRGFALLHMLIG